MSPRDTQVAPSGDSPPADGLRSGEAPLVIAYIASVSGALATAVMAGADTAERQAALERAVQIGAVVKIPTRRSVAFGIIHSARIEAPSSPPASSDRKILGIDLFGEMLWAEDGELATFQRGISVYPVLGQTIEVATLEDLGRIYARPKVSNVRIGSLHQDRRLPAYVMTDKLLGEHFAILGTSGSGKSCTVALVLRAVLKAHTHGHVVLLDPHNEYASAFADMAESITTENLKLPYWLLNFAESCAVMTSAEGATAESERGILKEAILTAKIRAAGDAATEHYTVDTPVPYRLSDLVAAIDEAMGRLNKADNSAPYLRLKTRIEALRADRRFSFMFSPVMMRDIMAEVLSRLLRIPGDGRPITVIDLSGVPSEIVDVVVSMIGRLIFDYAVWSNREDAAATLLVCEEAHRYVPREDKAGFGPTRRVVSQIAQEGRKYGVSLCLVTQRPSLVSETILSQCNTIFALRMNNDRDQQFVQRAMPESAQGFLAALPALQRQEAIVVGEGVTVPMRIRLADLEPQHLPFGRAASFSANWHSGHVDDSRIAITIDRWRRQAR